MHMVYLDTLLNYGLKVIYAIGLSTLFILTNIMNPIIKCGVPQGSILSPLLFIIVLLSYLLSLFIPMWDIRREVII